MASYTTRVKVTADRRIVIDVPEEIPLGDAEVTVSADPELETSGTGQALLEWMRSRPPMPDGYVARTKQEIDAEIQAMRDEWDR